MSSSISKPLALHLIQGGAYIVFALVLLTFAVFAPHFLSLTNIANIFAQTSILGILAFGLTVVVIAGGGNVIHGGIDLSVAATLGFTSAIYSTLINHGAGDAIAVVSAVGVGALAGSLNGLTIVLFRLPPLLATLAVMNLLAGLELVLTQNTVLPASSPLIDLLSGSDRFGIPLLGYLLLLIAAVLLLLIQYTPFGLRLYAIGEHREAARAIGLPSSRYVFLSYVISGVCGGLSGICASVFFSGSSTGSQEFLLPVIAIALLGVVFSRRFVPTIGGTLLSGLFIGALINGFQLLNISNFWVNGVQGALILAIVAASTFLRSREV